MNNHADPVTRPDSMSQVAVINDVAGGRPKPRLRGWIHLYSAVAAFFAGSALVVVSWALESRRAGHSTLTYALAIVAMFGVSAIYHRVHWESPVVRKWMRRLDHSMIFVFIAGSYTPFARLVMPRTTGYVVLSVVGRRGGRNPADDVLAVGAAVARGDVVPDAGLGGDLVHPLILHNAGVAATVLLAVGGALYSIGAVFYALRWPDPWPQTFGYHELFHACTAIAALCQYIAMWYAVF